MNYYIITMSKVHHKITQEQKESLMSIDASQVELEDGSVVKINSISDILPESKYYQTYPDKRPDETRNDFEDKYGDIGNQQVRNPTGKAKELMRAGFIAQQMSTGKTKEEASFNFDELKQKVFI